MIPPHTVLVGQEVLSWERFPGLLQWVTPNSTLIFSLLVTPPAWSLHQKGSTPLWGKATLEELLDRRSSQ